MNPMNTDTQLAILVALGTAMLAACSSKPDANESNFGAAMDHYFEKRGDLCLSTKTWPLDLKEFELRFSSATPTSPGAQMAALEAAGLVKSEEAEIAGFPDLSVWDCTERLVDHWAQNRIFLLPSRRRLA